MEDYHSMKRKELQALCKKHNIPAGSANSLLADKLSQLLNVQEKQKPITRQRACLKSRVETTDEGEPEVSKREAKKVNFSPTNDLFEYEITSVKKQQHVVRKTGARRNSVAKKVGNPVVDNDNKIELVEDVVQIPVKLTRSRVHILEKDDVVPNVGRRQGRSAAKDVVKEKDVNEEPEANVGKPTRSKVHVSGKCGAVQLDEDKQSKRPVKGGAKSSESVEEPVVIRARVTRSKAQSLTDADIDSDMKPQDKKKSGRQVAKAVQFAECAKEVVDIPVRFTRTRGQTVKEDIGNTVAKPQAEKKRTRKEMKATDQSTNSSNVALEDDHEHPKRKSSRTREVKVEDADEVDKVQMVDNRRVTRSRVTRSSISKMNKVEAQRKSKRVQQLEEPLERAVKKNAKRRESATQPVKIEEVPHPEEPVDAPVGRVTRRKSIMQKTQGKEIDPEKTKVVHLEKPVSSPAARVTRQKSLMPKAQSKVTDKLSFGKSQPVKETEMTDSPKSIEGSQSIRQSGSLSMISEGLNDKETVIRSGKDASDDKMKAVAISTIRPKSKKRRGTPIIEDGFVEREYVSPVEFSRRSIRSASKSEGKAVTHSLQNSAKDQLKSGKKICSPGGVGRDGSSKKRAKLSVMKEIESEDHGEKSNIEKTPISKPVTSELGERVIENEHTPGIDGSHRRFTHSAVGSNRKEPRQTAIKQQPIGDVHLCSDKVPKFRHFSAVKTAPGRVTRSGIKHAETVAISLSERVDKKKQPCESAHQRKSFVGESGGISDVVIIGAQSEMPEEVTDQILGQAGNSSASECARLSAELAKESKNETAITMESLSSLFDEQPSGVESLINFEVETPPGAHSNVKTSLEATPDAISDGSNVQNQVALDAAESVLKSGRPETYERELVNIGSTSKDLQSDVGDEEPVISVGMNVGMEESDLFGDGNFTYDSVSYSDASEQPGIKSKSEGEEETKKAEEGERGSAQKPVIQEPVSEDNNVHGNIEKLHSCDMADREVSHGELDREINKDDTVVQLSVGNELVGLSVEEDHTKDDIVTAHDSLAKQNVLSMGKGISFGLDMDRHGVANDLVDTVKESTQGPEFGTVSSIVDVCKISILGNMPSHGDDHVPSSVEREDEADKANAEHESNPKTLTDDKVCDTTSSGMDDEYNVSRLSKPLTDPSSANDIHETPLSGKDSSFGLATKRCGVEDDLIDAGKEPAPEPEFEVAPSTANDVYKMPSLGKPDGVDGGIDAIRESNGEDLVLSGEGEGDDADNTFKEHEPNSKLIHDGVSDTSVLGKDDYDNITRLFEPTLDPSSANDIVETPISGDDFCSDIAIDRSGVEDTGNEHAQDHEFELAPSAARESNGEDLVLSGEGEGDDADNTFKEHEPNSKLIHDGVSDTSVLGKDDYDNITRLFEPTLDTSSANDKVETPISGDDFCSDIAIDRNGVEDTGYEHAQDHEFELEPSAGNDVQEIPSLGESDSANASKECETDSVPSTGGKMPSGGGDGEGRAYNTNKEHQLKPKHFTDYVSDTSVLGEGNDYNITRSHETTSDPSTNDIVKNPFSVKDIFGESDNPIYDQKSTLLPKTDNDDVEDGVNNGRKELESGLDSSVTSYSPNVPVLGNNSDRNGQDGEPEPEHEHEQLTRIDMCAIGEQFVGGVGSEPDQNENITEDIISSTMADDAHEESSQDTDKDDVSDYFGDIYGIENAVEVTDTENDNWNEQKVTRTSAPDESAYLKGGDSISPGMNTAQITEETGQTIKSDHALSDKKEQPGTSMEDCSNSAVEMSNSPLVGDLKAQETPTREEKKSQKENMEDWGNYSSRMDGFHQLVLANKDNLLAKSTKDDQVSGLQSSARASSSIQERSSLAAAMVNSVNKLEHSSKNVTDRGSDQVVDLLKGNANMLEEDFNWSGEDLSFKSLFTTSAATQNNFKGEITRGNATGEENEICGVPSFEHFPDKYFENEVDGSIDWMGKNKHLELKGDQYDLSSEAASTSNHHESSGLNVSSMRSGVFGEKETQLKGSKTGDNLAFDKGT